MLQAVRIVSPQDFYEKMSTVCTTHPVGCNLIDNILDGILSGRRKYEDCRYWIVLDDNSGEVVGGAILTSPHGYLFSEMPIEATQLLGRTIADQDKDLFPFFRGPTTVVEHCLQSYLPISSRNVVSEDLDYLYALTSETFRPPKALPQHNEIRPVVESDRTLLIEWLLAFTEEAMIHLDVQGMADEFISMGTARFLCVDVHPVSLVHRGLPLHRTGGPVACRITTVYTPPSHRRQGFAQSLVASAAAEILAMTSSSSSSNSTTPSDGDAMAILAADSLNPASNALYLSLGFQRMCDLRCAFFSSH